MYHSRLLPACSLAACGTKLYIQYLQLLQARFVYTDLSEDRLRQPRTLR
jgi:hypothetical protein